ncbi:alpha-galactosidase [Streptomyces sp. ISL-90]|nr:alpha-galactosidase [Streptomyces sp. ISL-90]
MSAQARLRTRTTEYVVSVLPDGSGLVLDHWGELVDGPVEAWSEPDRIVSFATTADAAPLEFASAGQRHVQFSELLVDRGDGWLGAAWTLRGDLETVSSADGSRLTAEFADETGTLVLVLEYETSTRHDVVRRRMTVRNEGTTRIELPRAFSAGWNLPLGQAVHVDYLAGRWATEFQRRSIELQWGTFSIGSRQGVTGLLFSPVVTVTAANVRTGHPDRAYGVALEWSGSWRLQVDSTSIAAHTRVSCGVDEDTTTVTLLPRESFTSPWSTGIMSSEGPEGLTREWHRYQRVALARDLSPMTRPVVYNSWYATGFDVREDHQLELARIAAGLGVEAFVVDDGWFAGRTSDRAGLGDWTPDPSKFPRGLRPFADEIVALGMRFGLWIEPECVNPDSELYRAHPDWVYRAGDRPLVTVRNQLVLDLGRAEVVEWIEHRLRELLHSAHISYLKWDMNRPVSDGGRPGDLHGSEWSVQHTRGYYRVMRMLRDAFPHVTIEACASGGGRIDNAVLALSDVVWTSDQVGPRDRLVIQHGFLDAYPAHVMSSWVADDPSHRDRMPVSLGYRFAVAMSGVLGIGADLGRWTEAERAEATGLVARYRDIRPVVQRGQVVRHGDPHGDLYAIEYAGPADDPRIVVLVYDRDRDRTRDLERPRVHPTQLTPGVRYRVEGTEREVTRESARSLGIEVPFELAPDADLLVLLPIG